MKQLRHCPMCDLTILPADVAKHPKCLNCLILLEPAFNEKTVCWCGKYHNAPSVKDPRYCRKCMGKPVPEGTPGGQPERIEDVEDILSEIIQTKSKYNAKNLCKMLGQDQLSLRPFGGGRPQ